MKKVSIYAQAIYDNNKSNSKHHLGRVGTFKDKTIDSLVKKNRLKANFISGSKILSYNKKLKYNVRKIIFV